MTIEKIYLHIGYPKAGSTSIQFYLASIQKELKEQDILYPNTGMHSKGHHELAGAYQTPDVRLDWCATDDTIDYIKSLHNEAKESRAKVVFLSSEAFTYSISKNSLQQLKNDLSSLCKNIEIICFLRRQDAWIESAFTQSYKSAIIPFDFPNYAKDHEALFYDDFLYMWEDVFGINNIKLLLLDKEYGVTNALNAVCSILDISTPKVTEKSNERLAIEALHYSHHWHLEKGNILNGLLIHDLEKYSSLYPESRKYCFFQPKERADFLRKYEDENKKIALRYFDREQLFSEETYYDGYTYIDTTHPITSIEKPAAFLLELFGLSAFATGKNGRYKASNKKRKPFSIWHPSQKCTHCGRLLRRDIEHNCRTNKKSAANSPR